MTSERKTILLSKVVHIVITGTTETGAGVENGGPEGRTSGVCSEMIALRGFHGGKDPKAEQDTVTVRSGTGTLQAEKCFGRTFQVMLCPGMGGEPDPLQKLKAQ